MVHLLPQKHFAWVQLGFKAFRQVSCTLKCFKVACFESSLWAIKWNGKFTWAVIQKLMLFCGEFCAQKSCIIHYLSDFVMLLPAFWFLFSCLLHKCINFNAACRVSMKARSIPQSIKLKLLSWSMQEYHHINCTSGVFFHVQTIVLSVVREVRVTLGC